MVSNLLRKLFIGGLGFLGFADIIDGEMKNYNTNILKPVDNISIIMPCYNEEKFIQIAAWSIRNQSIIEKYPEYFEFILADSGSKDRTVELAEPYINKLIITPRGKLTARNIATDNAKGNIIVSVDADTIYPYHWLNTLLEPFNNLNHSSIIGISGSTFDYSWKYVPNEIFSVAEALYNRLINRNRIVGRNSAYWKHGHYLAGKFNENINQFNIFEIFCEEEELFGNRLSQFGSIIHKLNASCIHLGGIKVYCRFSEMIGFDNAECKKYEFRKERF